MQLEPCPFCGGNASVVHSNKTVINKSCMTVIEQSTTYWVKCDRCQVSQWYYTTEKDAVEAWNSRRRV